MSNKKEVLFLREEYGEGRGKYTFPDGQKYVGKWKNGREWNGTGYNKNGEIVVRFVNGKQIEQ